MANNLDGDQLHGKEISVSKPGKGEFTPLNQLINNAEDGSTIRLAKGKYRVNEIINLSKSIRLVGEGIGKTVLQGEKQSWLVISSGEHIIELSGISFQCKRTKRSKTVVKIGGEKLTVKGCSFSGGARSKDDDEDGYGLNVLGTTKIDIDDCLFEKNSESGLFLSGEVTGTISNCRFTLNDCGVAAAGRVVVTIGNCNNTKNNVGIAFDENAGGIVSDCLLSENNGGVLVKGESKPSIIKNKIFQNKAGIGLAENCEARVEQNELNDNQYGIMVRQEANAYILENQIFRNMTGIKCSDDTGSTIKNNQIFDQSMLGLLVEDNASSTITENRIFENKRIGMQVGGRAITELKKNEIFGNLLFGLLALGESRLEAENNILRLNGIKNIMVSGSPIVEVQNNIEVESEVRPVEFTPIGDELHVSAPSSGEVVSFKELISTAQPGQAILLEDGYYVLSESILIPRPLQLIAKNTGRVTILGSELEFLLGYVGEGKLVLNGINFRCTGPDKTNGLYILSGELEMDRCSVDGSRCQEGPYSTGLSIKAVRAAVRDSSFYNHDGSGMEVEDTSVELTGNKFYQNRSYGISLSGSSSGILQENSCFENRYYGIRSTGDCECVIKENECRGNGEHGIACGGNSKAAVLVNKCHSNKGGIIIGENSTPVVENNLFHGNLNGILIVNNSSPRISKNMSYENRDNGILISDNSYAFVEENLIYGNSRGVRLIKQARARIAHNKIYQNYFEGIDNSSIAESVIMDNELYANGDSKEGFFVVPKGVNPGNLLAQMLGSENLSRDPNSAAIPISIDMLDSYKDDQDADNDGEETGSEE